MTTLKSEVVQITECIQSLFIVNIMSVDTELWELNPQAVYLEMIAYSKFEVGLFPHPPKKTVVEVTKNEWAAPWSGSGHTWRSRLSWSGDLSMPGSLHTACSVLILAYSKCAVFHCDIPIHAYDVQCSPLLLSHSPPPLSFLIPDSPLATSMSHTLKGVQLGLERNHCVKNTYYSCRGLSRISYTCVKQLTTACNFISKVSDTLFRPL